MIATKKLITLTAVIALLISMASCSLFEKKAKFTQKITADNVEVTIREDMTEVDSVKNDEKYLTGYKWNGYGMNITKVGANETSAYKLNGNTKDDLLKKVGESGKNPSDIKKFGDISYIEVTDTTNKTQELFSVIYVSEIGYEYYLFEFYTLPKNGDKYRSEYETIVSSVKTIEEPAKTIDITIDGVALTVDGDAYSQASDTYLCSRYSVSVFNTNLSAKLASPEKFAEATIKSGNYKTAAGLDPEIKTTSGGAAYFEGMAKQLYGTHYIKDIDGKLYYIMFATLEPTDELLKSEFNDIVDAAHAA